MKVSLINPPFLNRYSKSSRSPAVTKSGTIYYPLWLSYAAGVLDKNGHEIQIIDAPAKSIGVECVLGSIASFMPQLVVIDTSTPSIDSDVQFAELVKGRVPGSKICLVGTHVSVFAEETLARTLKVDFVARHEYDYTIKELAEIIAAGSSVVGVKGLTYREGTEIRSNPDRDYIQDLDELPFVSEVYKKHLDIRDYFYAHVSYPTVSIFSSRGCPSRCFYCMYSQVMFGKQYRRRSAENLFQEFEYIRKAFPEVKEVLVDDDNFVVDQENVKQFCRLMIQHRSPLKWVVEVRVNLQYDTMLLMKKAGCKLLVAGFESGNQTVLDNMKKGITLQQSSIFAENAKKAKLRVHGCFMVGNPGENRETMMETLAFSKTLFLDTVQFFPLMVYPGTEAFRWAAENKYLTTTDFREWLDAEGMHNCILSTENLSAQELVDFCDYARKKFYLRPGYILKKALQSMADIDDAKRTFKAFGTFWRHLLKKGRSR